MILLIIGLLGGIYIGWRYPEPLDKMYIWAEDMYNKIIAWKNS